MAFSSATGFLVIQDLFSRCWKAAVAWLCLLGHMCPMHNQPGWEQELPALKVFGMLGSGLS